MAFDYYDSRDEDTLIAIALMIRHKDVAAWTAMTDQERKDAIIEQWNQRKPLGEFIRKNL